MPPRKTPAPRPARRIALAALAALALALALGAAPVLPGPALWAQGGPPRLSGPEKRQIGAIAKEPLLAALEGRAPREPQVGERLMASQAVAVSLYLDGRLLARSWELARPGPLAAQAMLLGASLLQSPDYGTPPGPDDLARVTVGVSVFYRFREIKDEGDLSGGDGVVVINGFKEGVAVPGDVDSPGDPTAILSFASEVAGMRPGAWMLPGTSLLAAQVDEERLDK